ncbi:MAG TPA: YqeG family HAD IIIA-type phosphatase [Trichocoleus sp.]|jgi:HAD superfamily phosphatase (TIGR01668 family)
MSWGKLLQPDLILGSPVLTLTPEILQQHHLKGLVLDVDETLVPMSMAEVSEELRQWVNLVRSTVSLSLVSNNLSQNRISRIAKTLNVPYILGARKPSRRKLKQAVDAMDLPLEQVAMVGDRLFTDVLAGNRLGMFTILVEPMVNPTKTGQRYLLRDFEVWFSQLLGVSINTLQQTVTHSDNS